MKSRRYLAASNLPLAANERGSGRVLSARSALHARFAAVTIAALFAAALVVGCSNSPQPVNDGYVKQATDKSAEAREIFVKAKGDLKAVSPEDRAKLDKLFGSSSETERIWNNMAHPMAGGAGADQSSAKK